jgi:hypothetical protein
MTGKTSPLRAHFIYYVSRTRKNWTHASRLVWLRLMRPLAVEMLGYRYSDKSVRVFYRSPACLNHKYLVTTSPNNVYTYISLLCISITLWYLCYVPKTAPPPQKSKTFTKSCGIEYRLDGEVWRSICNQLNNHAIAGTSSYKAICATYRSKGLTNSWQDYSYSNAFLSVQEGRNNKHTLYPL